MRARDPNPMTLLPTLRSMKIRARGLEKLATRALPHETDGHGVRVSMLDRIDAIDRAEEPE